MCAVLRGRCTTQRVDRHCDPAVSGARFFRCFAVFRASDTHTHIYIYAVFVARKSKEIIGHVQRDEEKERVREREGRREGRRIEEQRER